MSPDPQGGLPNCFPQPQEREGEEAGEEVECDMLVSIRACSKVHMQWQEAPLSSNTESHQATVPVRYCTNPDTGVIQQQDQEDFSLPLDPRRAPFDILESERLRTPRTELQQQVNLK